MPRYWDSDKDWPYPDKDEIEEPHLPWDDEPYPGTPAHKKWQEKLKKESEE